MSPAVLDFTDSYMRRVHSPESLLELAKELLDGHEFDTLAGTGLSGCLAVPQLARELGVNYLVIRKPGDGTHSHVNVEGKLGKRWVFVDDLIASGSTFRRVYEAIQDKGYSYGHETEFVGSFLYNEESFLTPRSMNRYMPLRERYQPAIEL